VRETEFTLAQAQALYDRGRLAEARNVLEKIVDHKPASVPTHFALAVTCWDLRDFRTAEGELRKVLAQEPKHSRAALLLGKLCEAQGRTYEGRDWYALALRLEPSLAEAAQRIAGITAMNDGVASSAPESRSRPEFLHGDIVTGIARDIRERQEAVGIGAGYLPALQRRSQLSIVFRLHADDGQKYTVLLRGTSFSTSPPQDGDRVAVPARWVDGRIEVSRLENLETGELLIAIEPNRAVGVLRMAGIIFALLWVVGTFVWVIYAFLTF